MSIEQLPLPIAKNLIGDDNGCWVWTASVNEKGYGSTRFRGKTWYVHRAVYTILVGEIPEGMHVHHHCETPRCANPDHLEVVTREQHGLHHRRTHCKHGHELTEENVYVRPDGNGRHCIACKRIRHRQSYGPTIVNTGSCDLCGVSLVGRSHNARFCCEDHTRKWHRQEVTRRRRAQRGLAI